MAKIEQETIELVPGSDVVEIGADSAIQLDEAAAVPGPAIQAGELRIWAKNTTPNTLMVTDDTGADATVAVVGAAPTLHAASHEDGGADELSIEDLATAEMTTTKVLNPDGAGGVVWAAPAGGAGGTELDANATSENLSCSRTAQTPTVNVANPGQVNLGSESAASHGTTGSYAGILSGLNNYVTHNYSAVLGGEDNDIAGSDGTVGSYNVIVGGDTNTILKSGSGTNTLNAILGGTLNNITNTSAGTLTHNIVLGGASNAITSAATNVGGVTTHNAILSGASNTITTTGSTGDATYNVIVGGNANSISTNTTLVATKCFIGGGYGNIISGTADASVIVGGGLSGGFVNEIYSSYSFIGGGTNNTIAADSNACVIVGGNNNDVVGSAADFSFIGGGVNQEINSSYGVIVGGSDNVIVTSTSDHCFIGGGESNSVSSSGATHSTIGGGSANTITSTSIYNTICGGRTNNIVGAGQSSFIGGGINNDVTPLRCVVVGGSGNDITNASGGYSCIGGGQTNQITASATHQTISGGTTNTISGSGIGGTISGGSTNTVSAAYGTVAGGLSCTAAGAYGFAVGRRAKADSSGSMALGDDRDQDALATTTNELLVGMENGIRLVDTVEENGNVWRVDENQTTDATLTNAYTNTLADNSAVSITARVTAMKTDGSERAFYIVNALVYRDGGGATLEGAVDAQLTRESAGAAAGGWDATIVVSGNTASVQITGEAATTINWRITTQYQVVT